MNKSKSYEKHSSTFLLTKLSRVRTERDMLKMKYEDANTARIGWKLLSVILLAIFIGRWFGGVL